MILAHLRPSPAEKALIHSKLAGASVPCPAVCLQREFEPNLDWRLTPGTVPGLGAERLVHTCSPGVQSVSGHNLSGRCHRCPGVGLSLQPPSSPTSHSEQCLGISASHPPIPRYLPPSPLPIRSRTCCPLLEERNMQLAIWKWRVEQRRGHEVGISPIWRLRGYVKEGFTKEEACRGSPGRTSENLWGRRDMSGRGNLLGRPRML